MAGAQRVLLVASWGYPPSWREYVYEVRLERPGLGQILRRRLGAGWSCRSCSSTLVLHEALRRAGFECETLVFGLDSAVDPSSAAGGGELRERALQAYREWLRQLWESCSCCGGEPEGVEVTVMPALGSYHGWRFEGSVDHMFNTVFARVLRELRSTRYTWVVVDLTHGVNFQVVATLYGAVAAAITVGAEDRLVLANSEPARAQTRVCVRDQGGASGARGGGEEAPGLGVLDVTRLQEAVKFIRMVSGVKRLNSVALDAGFLKDLKSKAPRLAGELERSLLPFLTALANAIAAPTYFEVSCVDEGGVERRVLLNPCLEVKVREVEVPSYEPELDRTGRVVRYPETSVYASLSTALEVVLEDLCSQLREGRDLIKYLSVLADRYREARSFYAYYTVRKEVESLKLVSSFASKCPHVLSKLSGEWRESKTIPAALYAYLVERSHELADSMKRGECVDLSREEYEEWRERVLEERRKLERVASERELRNMMAHAGLEYAALEALQLAEREGELVVEKVVYSCRALRNLLKQLGIGLRV